MVAWKQKLLLKSVCLVFLSLLATTCNAGFSTYSNNWPTHLDEAQEQDPEQQIVDSAASPVSEANNTNLTVTKNPAPNLDNRLYFNVAANFNNSSFRDLRNHSSGAFTGLILVNRTSKDNYVSWEIGAGTKIKGIRTEVGYVKTKKLQYNQQPIFTSNSTNVASEIVNNSILLTLFYDFENFKISYFNPYVGALGGVSWNRAHAASYGGIGNNVYENTNNYGIAWGLTCGLRMPISDHWVGYFSYRYANLAKARIRDNNLILDVKGKFILSSFIVGINFII